MNPSGIRKTPRTTPKHPGESPETDANRMKFGRNSDNRADTSGQSINLSACADLP
jgi:hypothetical protein